MNLMDEKEKLLSEFERIIEVGIVNAHHDRNVLQKVREMLEEQEPKLIIRKQGMHENSDGSIDYFALWYCPHCNKLLQRGFCAPWIEHCYKCGKAVKWEK